MKIGNIWINRLGLHNFKLFLKNTNWKNRIPILLFLLRIKKKVNFLKFTFYGENRRWILRHIMGLEKLNSLEDAVWLTQYLNSIFNDEKIIEFSNFRFKHLQPILFKEIFMNKEYDVKTTLNGTILDIGANVGDTALYFANKGYNVIAVEPIKDNYNKAFDNLMLNDFSDKITLMNAGVGIEYGKEKIYINDIDCGSCSAMIDSENFELVSMIPIDVLIEDYKPNIVKIDCEGCEEKIINHSEFKGVEEIWVEVHTHLGINKKSIIKRLKVLGFDIEEKFNILHGVRNTP